MKDFFLVALKDSIGNWEKRARGKVVRDACPLCNACSECFFDATKNKIRCPVYEATGKRNCERTPYWDWVSNMTPENAQKEVDFLKSLLPKEEPLTKESLTKESLKEILRDEYGIEPEVQDDHEPKYQVGDVWLTHNGDTIFIVNRGEGYVALWADGSGVEGNIDDYVFPKTLLVRDGKVVS